MDSNPLPCSGGKIISKMICGMLIAIFAVGIPFNCRAEGRSWFSKTNSGVRYQPEVDVGLCLGFPWYEASRLEVRTIQGIRFNPNISAGIGLAFNVNTFGLSMPVTLNLKYIVLAHKNTTPFVSLDAGWAVMLGAPHTGEGAPCGEFAFGLRHRHFQYSMGYNIQAVSDNGLYFGLGGIIARFALWF